MFGMTRFSDSGCYCTGEVLDSWLAHFTDVMMTLFASQSLAHVNNDSISLWYW